MDKSPKEILAELDAELSALKARVGEIEKKVELLRNELDLEPAEPLDLGTADYLYDIADAVPEDIPAENVPEAVADDMPADVFAENAGENVGESVPDDIPEAESESESEAEFESEPEAEPETEDLPESSEPEVEQESAQEVEQEPEDLPEAVPGKEVQAEPETEAEPEQVAGTEPEAESEQVAGPAPEDLPEEDGFSLFGGMAEEEEPKARKTKAPSEHRQYSGHKVIADQKYGNEAWRKDMPGPEVKDVRSAISLNDRVMFISTLFRDDSMLFQDVINKINALTTLEKAVQYLKENFPEWDMDSELVYRFMMSVRRKIR